MTIHDLLSRLIFEVNIYYLKIPTTDPKICVIGLDPRNNHICVTDYGIVRRVIDQVMCYTSFPLTLKMNYARGIVLTHSHPVISITPKQWLEIAKRIEKERPLQEFYKQFPLHIPQDLRRIIVNEYIFEDFYNKIKICYENSINN